MSPRKRILTKFKKTFDWNAFYGDRLSKASKEFVSNSVPEFLGLSRSLIILTETKDFRVFRITYIEFRENDKKFSHGFAIFKIFAETDSDKYYEVLNFQVYDSPKSYTFGVETQ